MRLEWAFTHILTATARGRGSVTSNPVMLSPVRLSTPFLGRRRKEMLRIASAETDWRSHSLTAAWLCQAFLLRSVSGFCLLAAR
eukprot:3827698-Heterocapsa_arctica.AAC.2